MARANGRPPPCLARALGTTATTEARTPLGNRGRSADRSRRRLSRSVGPGQPSAHHCRARRNDPRHAAAGSVGDPPLSWRAGRAPIAARLALRDLARYQARSGAALAAITLALGIAAAVVITAAAAEKQEDDRAAAGLPNLSDRQIRVYTGPTQRPELIPLPIQTPAQLARSAARVRHLAAGLARQPSSRFGRPSNPASRPSSKTAIGPSSPSVSRGKSTPRGGPWDRVSMSPRLLCSGTSESTPPRSIRAQTSWPTRPSPPTSSSFWTSGRGSNSPSRTSSGSTARKSSAPGEKSAAYRPRSSRSMGSGATAGRRSRAVGSSSRAGLSPASRSPPPASSPPRLASRSRRSERAPPSPRRSPSQPPLARSWRSPSSP